MLRASELTERSTLLLAIARSDLSQSRRNSLANVAHQSPSDFGPWILETGIYANHKAFFSCGSPQAVSRRSAHQLLLDDKLFARL